MPTPIHLIDSKVRSMIKTHSPDSSPEEMADFLDAMKATAAFLNNNPKAKALMEAAQTKSLSESEFAGLSSNN